MVSSGRSVCISRHTDQSSHHQDPETDEEDGDHDNDRPFRDVLVVPQVAPVSTTVRALSVVSTSKSCTQDLLRTAQPVLLPFDTGLVF